MHFTDILVAIWGGFGVTVTVVALALLYAIPFALVFGTLQHELKDWRRAPVTAFIEFWRSSPIVVLLFVFYYALPMFRIELSALSVGSLVLGMNMGGYGTQAVRAGLQAVDRGQKEAAIALGLSPLQDLMLVQLPQALRAGIPTYVNLFIQLVKGTALVSLLSLADMTYRAKEIAQVTFAPAPAYMGLLLSYFVICYPLTVLGRSLERRHGASNAKRNV
ncbi:amino acid ABC transporter permease [Chitinasiproducens palmae]|uniref:Amino acid ABC transporter membrane protein 1, PAAT family n=1 Tax=Chitinasiproducens palmae TaxID=1770053 RepID=A0A1H2PPQ3_9BURK|nr:amino acid ABC transporter permease [Chitinasiproducens palmae]SDV48762.1 amino acid ABC transporter membrane protein 1, PAAT family [Chitinasiproducens palmae]